jgi:hypothetical protein
MMQMGADFRVMMVNRFFQRQNIWTGPYQNTTSPSFYEGVFHIRQLFIERT